MPHLPDHQSDHDPLLIAAFAAGDAQAADLERAQLLVATCEECAALHHDLRSIAAAMPAVPAPVRRRDFRLSPEQAQELRPSGWRRLLAPLAGPRFTFAAPLGGSLAALGLAGILVAGAASTPIAGTGAGAGGGAGNEGTANAAASIGAEQNQPAAAAGLASAAPDTKPLAGSASAAASSGDAYLAVPAPAASAGAAPPAAAGGLSGPGGEAGTGPAASQTTRSAEGAGTVSSAASPGLGAEQDVPSAAAIAGPLDVSTAAPAPAAGLPPAVAVASVVLLLVGLVLLGLRVVATRTRRIAG
jgi:hypothetical protein